MEILSFILDSYGLFAEKNWVEIFCAFILLAAKVQLLCQLYCGLRNANSSICNKIYKALLQISKDDCVICMLSLYEDPEQTLHDPLLGENNQKRVKKVIMKTPCNHRFHISCLIEWTKVKLECPTCRQKLPPLE